MRDCNVKALIIFDSLWDDVDYTCDGLFDFFP